MAGISFGASASLSVSSLPGASGAFGFREPAECVIEIDGKPIEDLYPYLTEVSVECGRVAPATATLTFATQRDEQGNWVVQDRRVLVSWRAITIKAAFGSHTEEIMRGCIRNVRAEYPRNAGEARVIVECQDESLLLDRMHQRRNWGAVGPTSDREIVEAIAMFNNLAFDEFSAVGAEGLSITQDDTDISFLRERAQVNGYELIIREGTLYFGPMRLEGDPQSPIRVYAGPDSNCVSISVNTDGHRPAQVGFDVAEPDGSGVRREIVGPNQLLLGKQPANELGDGASQFTWLLSREGATDEGKLRLLAQRRANEFSMRVEAEGELDGTLYGHVLRVGLPVPVDGLGEWLGGMYYVDQVRHTFSTEGYQQTFKLLRNAYGDNVDWSAVDLLAGVR